MAKVNRYTRLTPTQFTPRSVEEIMMVPLAKQRQHEQAQAELSKLEDFDFNRLQGDEDISARELAEYKGKVDQVVNKLAESGVSGANRAAILDLNRELKKKTSQTGAWGKRASNYAAQQAWIEDMKKKESMAGWSPQDVQRFIGQTVQGFKTDADDGTYRQFQGAALPEYVDKQKYVSDLLKNTSEETLRDLGIQHKGKVSFTDLYSDDVIKGKDREKLFNYLKNTMMSDKKFISSTMMENRLGDIREENPIAFGKYVTKTDPLSGKSTKQYQPASMLDRYLYSSASGAAYKDLEKHSFKVKDDYGVALMKAKVNDMFDKTGMGMVKVDGVALQDMSATDYDKLNYDLSNIEASVQESSKVLTDLIKQGYSKGSPEYQKTLATIQKGSKDMFELKSRLDTANQKGVEALNSEDRALYDAASEYDSILQNSITPADQKIALSRALGRKPAFSDSLDSLKREFYIQKGVDSNTYDNLESRAYAPRTAGFTMATETPEDYSGVDQRVVDIQNEINKGARKSIEEDNRAGKSAITYEVISSDDSDTFNQEVNNILDSISGKNFNLSNFSNSNTGRRLLDDSSIISKIGDKPEDIDLKQTKVSLISSTTRAGNPQFLVTFYNNLEVEADQIRVTMGQRGTNITNRMSDAMVNSTDYKTRELGRELQYNTMDGYLASTRIKEARPNSSGYFSDFKFNGNENTKWERVEDSLGSPRFTLNLNGKETTELSSLADVRRYMFLAERMTSSGLDAATRNKYKEEFDNTYGRSELLKYAK